MSASLLRRGLELLADDVKDNRRANKKKAQRQRTTNLAATMLPVETHQQRATKSIKRLQSRVGPTKSKATVKNKPIKCALEEFKRRQRRSSMSVNLKYFTDTSCATTESETKKIISHNTGRQSRNTLNRPVKKAKKPESLFTEEEFQQFQKEYFGSLTK